MGIYAFCEPLIYPSIWTVGKMVENGNGNIYFMRSTHLRNLAVYILTRQIWH